MPRTFYSDYVQRCMRFYVRYSKPEFLNGVDKENWIACARALKSFSRWERYVLLAVYRNGDTLVNNVYRVSKKQSVEQEKVWGLIHKLEYRIAKERGLL